jgi:sulfatase modifying factor 1
MRRLFSFQYGMQLLSGIGTVAGLIISSFAMSTSSHAGTVTFGSGANTFNMEFVTIGNPGNAADSIIGGGSVGYTYGIGKFEVSEGMIEKFNASQSLQITKSSLGPNKPAWQVSWNEAARFVNWLNTSTGGFAAYKFTTGGVNDNVDLWTAADVSDYDPLNTTRSIRAKYVLPTYDEWHKAAYYNGSNNTYYVYPNGRNTPPSAVTSGTDDNTAVYNQTFAQGPANVDEAGGVSPYGVMGLGGNVREWQESSLRNSAKRLYRGGDWMDSSSYLQASVLSASPNNESGAVGFRVALLLPSSPPPTVPEPTSMAIFGLGALGMAYRARRKAKAKSKQA